jgi:hypothetical protein
MHVEAARGSHPREDPRVLADPANHRRAFGRDHVPGAHGGRGMR